MTSRFAKVSEIADRFRVSPDAVYLWIRQGKIPSDCVIRIAGTVRVDQKQFGRRLRAGTLYRARRRKRRTGSDPLGQEKIPLLAEDSFTTVESGPRIEHAWTSESGNVQSEHPFSPEMIAAAK
jgi:hypothetical protein